MKKILSEKNFAAILFVLVLIAFSFAHEDSKKRDVFYNASFHRTSSSISAASVNQQKEKINTQHKIEVAQN